MTYKKIEDALLQDPSMVPEVLHLIGRILQRTSEDIDEPSEEIRMFKDGVALHELAKRIDEMFFVGH